MARRRRMGPKSCASSLLRWRTARNSTGRDSSRSIRSGNSERRAVRNHPVSLFFLAAALAVPSAIFAQTALHSDHAKEHAKERVAAAPDFSGVWFIDEYKRNILPNEDPPFQPWADALFKERTFQNTHRTP